MFVCIRGTSHKSEQESVNSELNFGKKNKQKYEKDLIRQIFELYRIRDHFR